MKKYIFACLLLCLSLGLWGCREATVEETDKTTEIITAEPTTEPTTEMAVVDSEDDVYAFADLPSAYRDILECCVEIIETAEAHNLDLNKLDYEWGSLSWFADQSLHADGNPRDVLCYSLTDLNNDGTDELILATKYIKDDQSLPSKAGYSIINIYTLDRDEAVMLAYSWNRNDYYINSDGVIVNELTAPPAYHEIFLYSYEENCLRFTEKYHMYIAYAEDKKEVELYESADGAEPVLLASFDDPNDSEQWEKLSTVRKQYTSELLELELIPICSN